MNEQPKQDVDLLIEGGIVITMDAERRIYNPGYVAIRGEKIVGIGSGPAHSYSAKERFDASGMVVLPGIVNAHDHLDQSVHRSCGDELPPPKTRSRDRLLHRARGLTRERARAAAALSLLELVHYGVTTTQENHWTHYHLDSTDGICEAIQQSGMRAVVSRGISDKEEYTPADFRERAEDVLDDLDRLEREYDSDRICITSEPTTILRCKPETIIAMRDWALRRGKMWHIHLAQGREELAEALRTVGTGSVQYAESLGVLGPDMLAIHCSGILDEEVELLGKYQVRISHCPVPIMRGGGVVPPIWELEKLGAVVAIGTDGSGTNNSQNPWEAMKMAVYMQRVRFGDRYLGTAEQALEMMTIKAARVLDMEDRVGSLEPGKEADVALFRRDQVHLVPDAMLVNNLVYSGLNNMADTVLVGGKVILRGGRSTVFDEEEVIARVREAQAGMIKEAGHEGEIGLTSSWPVITP
jgi:5-methylthioadenosine/S-adenosylhomocysteine deaminase